MEQRRSNSPQSVTRVIRILEALCAASEPLSLAQLSRTLDAPKSSVAALLRGLAEAHFVIVSDGVYRLGPAAFGLGSALVESRRRFQTSDLIRDGMRRLAARSGETVLFAVRDQDGQGITYVDVIESTDTVRFAVSVGDRRPLYCTSGGRVLLAALPEDELHEYLHTLNPGRLTDDTVVDKGKLTAIVEQARATGVAQTVNQAASGAAGTAAAIRDATGAAIGALIVAAPSSRLHDALPDMVREEAERISDSLGYRQ